jgi:glycosyltransferase involved in cell wall biosynthesis
MYYKFLLCKELGLTIVLQKLLPSFWTKEKQNLCGEKMPDSFWKICTSAIHVAKKNNIIEATRLCELAEQQLDKITFSELRQKRSKFLLRLGAYLRNKEDTSDSLASMASSLTVEDTLALLRTEYGTPNVSLPKSGSFPKSSNRTRHQIIEGARPVITWGGDHKQVVGRDPFPLCASRYEQIALGRAALEGAKNRKIANHFYIVTPSFNSEKFIEETIRSVVSQKGNFYISYHIQDGGSYDNTLEIISRWQLKISQKQSGLIQCEGINFSFSSKPDDGMYDAINQGFKALMPPENAICTWINSDDVMAPDSLLDVLKVMISNNDAYWILGNVSAIDASGTLLFNQSVIYPTEIIMAGLCDHRHWRFIQQEGSFWRAHLWSLVDGLDPTLKLCGDWDLWRRFAALTDPIHVQKALAYFRRHTGQLSGILSNYYREMESKVSLEEQVRMSALLQFKSNTITKNVTSDALTVGSYKYRIAPISRKNLQPIGKSHTTERLVNALLVNFYMRPLRVLTFCTLVSGGAGTGSLRRVNALRSIGIDAKLITFSSPKYRNEKYIGEIALALDAMATSSGTVWQRLSHIMEVDRNNSGFRASEFFSTTESALDMKQLKSFLDDADILHFHWVAGMLNYGGLPAAIGDKPIVWTTADMNPFTGGCHYSEGCDGFMRTCEACPLIGDRQDIPRAAWLKKRNAYEKLNITLVCPSKSIAELARKSSLLGDKAIVVIPNAYPVEEFNILDKLESRKKINLPLNKKIILLGADDLASKRKGGDILINVCEALARCHDAKQYEFVTFGYKKLEISLAQHSVGYISGEQLSQAYSAADMFVSLSREDVGPMTIVESLLCGTPVVAFQVGIAPEVIEQRSTGIIARCFDTDSIVHGIECMAKLVDNDEKLAQRCRKAALEYGNSKILAERHKDLYNKLLGRKHS